MGIAQRHIGGSPPADGMVERVIRFDEQHKMGIEVIQRPCVKVLVEISGQVSLDKANGVAPFGIVPSADHEAFLHGLNVELRTIQGRLLIVFA